MSKRKLLYGYQIQNGELTVVKAEASVVARVASLYLEGLSYQKLADLLNQEHIPFSKEVPVWDKHKVKRLLENPRYTGQNGYPGILDTETFQCVQSRIQEKTAKQTPKAERQILKLADRLHCASCGSTLYRMGGKNHRKDTLYLKCAHCGITITIQDEILLEEVIHQMEEWDRPEQTSYQPSGEVIRLTNAINRGLEHPDDPQEVISLILQGVAARYACCPDTQEHKKPPAGCVLGPHPAGGFSYQHIGRKYGESHLPTGAPGKDRTWNRQHRGRYGSYRQRKMLTLR